MKKLLKCSCIFKKNQKYEARWLCHLPFMFFFLLLVSCPTSPPAELPTRYYKMQSATYYALGGQYGPRINVELTSDSPQATQIFADANGAQLMHWNDVISVPGKQISGSGGDINSIEIDLFSPLDPVSDQGIAIQADTTIWFYIKDYTGFLCALVVSAKCRFETPSVPIVFAGQ